VESLDVLYEDASLVVVNKPSGVLVHRSGEAPDRVTCMQLLRNQLGHHVFPLHRLDRQTSGVLVFARDAEAAARLCALFAEGAVSKRYLAVVRGWCEEAVTVDRPLRDEDSEVERDAVTRVRLLARVELPVAVGPYESARFSLVEACPETGRRHQIRRHLRSISHPIVGDTRHGEGRQNRLFREHFGVERMLLHALALEFTDPGTGLRVNVEAPLDTVFLGVCERFGWPTSGLSGG